jgi:hypothetical protein
LCAEIEFSSIRQGYAECGSLEFSIAWTNVLNFPTKGEAYTISLLGEVALLAMLYGLRVVWLRADLAPKFYSILSSPWLLNLPGWALVATGAGAEPSA